MRDLNRILCRAAARGWTFTVAPAHHTEMGWWAAREPLDALADINLAEALVIHWGHAVLAFREGPMPRGRMLVDLWQSEDEGSIIVDVTGAALVALHEELL